MYKDVGKRIMALLLSVCMIAGMVDLSGFTVHAEDAPLQLHSVEVEGTYIYDGSQQQPAKDNLKVYYSDAVGDRQLLTDDTAYAIESYGENLNSGTQNGTVTVRAVEGKGYAGSVTGYFSIGKREITDSMISPIEPCMVQTGDNVEPEVTVIDSTVKDPAISSNGGKLRKGTDYTVDYDDNYLPNTKGKAIIKGIGNYQTGSDGIIKEFTLTEMMADKINITLTVGKDSETGELYGNDSTGFYKIYTGEKLTLKKGSQIQVSYENQPLDPEDYEVVYNPNRNQPYVGDVIVNVKIISGTYKGLETNRTDVGFYIRRNMNLENNTRDGITYNSGIKASLVSETEAEINLTDVGFFDANASTEIQNLLRNTPEEVIQIEVGTGWQSELSQGGGDIEWTAKITKASTGTHNKYYSGEIKVPVTITVPELTEDMIHIENNGIENPKMMFDGTTEWLEQIIRSPQNWIRVGNKGSEYALGTDYTVSKKAGTTSQTGKNAGEYWITVTPTKTGKLRGEPKDKKITVDPMPLTGTGSTVQAEVTDVTYSPAGIPNPKVTLAYLDKNNVRVPMVPGSDYSITGYKPMTGVGPGAVNISGLNNFKNSTASLDYNILQKDIFSGTNVSVSEVPNELPYNWGEAVVPDKFTVTMDGYTLKENVDYKIEYKDRNGDLSDHNKVADGQITMHIKGIGNYKGENTNYDRSFTIVQRELKDTEINVSSIPDQIYTGEPITPAVELTRKRGGKKIDPTEGYTVDYSNHIEVSGSTSSGKAKITITGTENFTGTLSAEFVIKACDLSNLSTLHVTAESEEDSAIRYDLLSKEWKKNYYIYTGDKIELSNYDLEITRTIGEKETDIKEDDIVITYSANQEIGKACMTISASNTGNYKGKKDVYFAIKGDLSDWSGSSANKRTKIVIEPQEYTNANIVPEDVKVTFLVGNGPDAQEKPLTIGKHFSVTNADTGITTVGSNPTARITGEDTEDTWMFTGFADETFEVKEFDLSGKTEAQLEAANFLIDMTEDYIYSGCPITPEPEITHSGNPVETTTGYDLSYYDCNGEDQTTTEIVDTSDASLFGVGDYKVRITGNTNYKGYTEKDYTISPYVFKEDPDADTRVNITGTEAGYVVLDQIKYPDEYASAYTGNAMMELDQNGEKTDNVIWDPSKLKITFTPVNMENAAQTPVDLVLGQDYYVTYENNTKPGTATLVVHGMGNFDGEIREDFQILADLGGTHTEVKVKDCTFTPANDGEEAANKPEVTVWYTQEIAGVEQEPEALETDTYTVAYTNNESATHPYPGKEAESALDPEGNNFGQATVSAKQDEAGKYTGATYGTKAEGFKIYQRDLATIRPEDLIVPEDSDVPDTPDIPDTAETPDDSEEYPWKIENLQAGYEYNETHITPEPAIFCKQVQLDGETQTGETEPSGDYDYRIWAENNLNVWTFENADMSGKRLHPIFTVEARRDAQQKYDGNYCGKVSQNFKITPRPLEEKIDTAAFPITNSRIADKGTTLDKDQIADPNGYIGTENDKGEWECDYTRTFITFPKEGKGIANPEKNDALSIKWSGDGVKFTELVEGQDYNIEYIDNVKIGDAKIHIEAPEISNYAGSYDKHFKIMASITEVDNANPVPPGRYIELSYEEEVPYGKVATYPDLIFEDMSGIYAGSRDEAYILEEGEDKDFVIITEKNYQKYGLSEYSQNNIEVTEDGAKATVVVQGVGYYKGSIKKEYTIVPKDINDPGIAIEFVGSIVSGEYKNAYIYNGNEQKPEINLYNNNKKDMENVDADDPDKKYDPYQPQLKMAPVKENNNGTYISGDYRIKKWDNNIGPVNEKGVAKVLIEGVGKNYKGERWFEFNIILRQMETLTYEIKDQDSIIYNGAAQTPEVEVSYNDGSKKVVLVPGTDYDLEYENNVDVPMKVEAPAEGEEQPPQPTITFTGKGGYDGTHKINFDIKPRDITKDEIVATAVAMYNSGGAVIPIITVKDTGILTGKALEPEKDYQVVEGSQTGETEIAEEGTVDIAGKGNYTGTKKVTFRIIPPDGVLTIEEIPEQEFTNSPIMPEVQVSLVSPQIETPFPLNENDYEVRYTDNLKAGTAKVIITGTGAFEDMGTVEREFTITPKSIGSKGLIDSAMEMGAIEPQWYSGRPIVPGVELKFQPALKEGEETNNPVILIPNTDYRVTAVNNTMVGEATATITGIGNYTGVIETKFRIHGNMNLVDVAPIPTQEYTGSPVTPVPQVSIGGKAMVEGTDYRVEYSNNVDRGTASITITGTEDWYFGTKVVKFDIARELSAETSVRGVASVYTYTGAAITPPVRVEDDGNLLVSGVDYDIAYSENINAGTAVITITGKGKYTGGTTASFKISPQQLGRAKISPVSDQIFNGKEQNPPITVTSGSTTLQSGKDYSVVYVNSATPGMASVIVKGEGNYTGTQTINYSIKVPEVTGVKVSKYTNKSVTISWTKNDVVSGYEIYNSKNRRAARVNKPTTTKGTVSKLSAGTSQTFRVRAYVNKDGQYYYGPFTSVKAVTAPNSTKISSLKSTKKKQVAVKWKKVKGATQYQVYRSTSKKGKYKKLATTKKTSYTDKKATGGKKYYYKIRVCKKINKKNYYSSYSAVKSVKAKK